MAFLAVAGAPPANAAADGPQSWAPGDACPSVLVIGARGSGQAFDSDGQYLGLGPEVHGFARSLHDALQSKGRTVSAWPIPYPAVPIGEALTGTPDIFESAEFAGFFGASMVSDAVQACLGATQIVLAGFSQGAMAAREVAKRVDFGARGAVSALVLIGDPLYGPDSPGTRLGSPTDREGILTAEDPAEWIGDATLHVCVAGDLFCQWEGPGSLPERWSLAEAAITHTEAYSQLPMRIAMSSLISLWVLERCSGRHATVIGTTGDDELEGTSGDDVIIGHGGDDEIDAGGGDDLICADADTDFNRAGDATAEAGADVVDGGAGDDVVFAGAGDDLVRAGSGNDAVVGAQGDDTLRGQSGADFVDGGDGQDLVRGSDNAEDTDTHMEDEGGGVVAMAYTPEHLDGGSGDDVVQAPAGADLATGGSGNDTVSASSGYVDGADGNDTLTGGEADQYIDGGAGDDHLDAGGGHDFLDGGPGADTLLAGGGSDYLQGGDDADQLVGGAGVDFFDAGSGDDNLQARDQEADEYFFCDEGIDRVDADQVEDVDVIREGCEQEVGSDAQAPQVTVAPPIENAEYDLGAVVRASYACADEDEGSGIRSCTGTVPDGAPIDTSSSGWHTFAVTATDNAGNTTSETVRYRVRGGQAITFGQPSQRSYGDQPFTVGASASSGLPVTLSADGACRVAGGTVTIVSSGECVIVASQPGNDHFRPAADVRRTVHIAKARLLAAADDATVVYGDPGNLTGGLTGLVAGDQIAVSQWINGDGPRAHVGTHPVVPVFDDPNGALGKYDVVRTGTVTVTPRTLELTGGTQTREYGDENPLLAGVVRSGLLTGDDVSVTWATDAAPRTPVGRYPTTAVLSGDDAGNYRPQVEPGVLEVGPRSLTVAANDVSRPYGHADDPFGGTLTGLVNDDPVTARYTTTATATSPPGRYTIRPEVVGDPNVLANYRPTLVDGELTVVDLVGGLVCTITGTAEGETITGTPGDDVICALDGNDLVSGRGGDDVILGGEGKDRLWGNRGDDHLDGQAGKDQLYGDDGADTLVGGAGAIRDLLDGGSGNDQLAGGDGDDVLYGRAGLDTLDGGTPGEARDVLDGGADSDRYRIDPLDLVFAVETGF